MSSNYSTIQQHEPLRVPSGWGASEKRLIAQLEEILDDLYSRFNRLKMSDLGKDLQNTIKGSSIELIALRSQIDNLLPDSKRDRTSTRFLNVDVHEILADHIGETITVSFEIKGETARTFRVYAYQNRGVSISESHDFTMPTTDFARFSFTTTVKDWGLEATGTTLGSIAWYDTTGTQNYTVRKIKIELGNVATDWAPSLEDAEALENAAVRIDPDGIRMKGGKMEFEVGSEFKVKSGGVFNVFATSDDSVIRFGGTEQNPNFSLGNGGIVKAKKVITDELAITDGGSFLETGSGSQPLSEVIVADAEPQNVHGVLWLKPSGSTGTSDFTCNAGGTDMTNWDASQQLTCQGNALTGNTFTYGCKFSIYIYGTACYLDTIKVEIQGGGTKYTVYQHTYNRSTDIKMLRPGDTFDVDNLANPVTISDNLTSGNITLIVSWQKSDVNGDPVNTGAQFANQAIVRCSGTGSQSTMTCEVKYIP